VVFYVTAEGALPPPPTASGGSTLGPGGAQVPQILPTPQIFGHSSSATGWINWFYSKFRLAVVAS